MTKNNWDMSIYYKDTIETKLIKRLLKIANDNDIELWPPTLDAYGVYWENRRKMLSFYFNENLTLTMNAYCEHPFADSDEDYKVIAPTTEQIIEELVWITDPHSVRFGTELNELFKVNQ